VLGGLLELAGGVAPCGEPLATSRGLLLIGGARDTLLGSGTWELTGLAVLVVGVRVLMGVLDVGRGTFGGNIEDAIWIARGGVSSSLSESKVRSTIPVAMFRSLCMLAVVVEAFELVGAALRL
jgi:hypothetical protein